MEKVYFFRIVVALILLTLLGCGFNKNNLAGIERVSPLTKKEYDSLREIIFFSLEPERASKAMFRLSREAEMVDNEHELAKRYRLMVWYYLMSADYQKGDDILDKLQKYYSDFNRWSDYVSISKIRAISYRGREKYDEIEKILKEAIEISNEKDVHPYDLLPIHELSVFYSYDIGKHKEAVKYGDLFFERLKQYDTITSLEKRKVLDSIKRQNLDVINLTLAKSYTQTNELDKAYECLKRAEKGFGDIDDVEKIMRVYSNFIDYYLKKEDLSKVELYKGKYLEYSKRNNDSLVSSLRKMTETNLNLVTKEKDGVVVKEENKRKLLIIGSLGTFLLLVIIFQRYFLRLKYEKEKIRLELENEQDFKKFRASLFINIAHEIRTPLSLILGYIDLSADKSISGDELRKYLGEIRRKSNKVINNISDIIALLREDKKEEDIRLESVIIEPFLQQLFFSFESIAKIKNIELNYSVELPVNFALQTNLNKLESLVNNLVSNAIKFSQKNTKVTFIAFIEEDMFYIQVIDQGSGISEENQKNIFSKFYQEEKKGKSEGFGIGLAIVKDIVDNLNGTIEVESKPNEGAAFKVQFPIVNEETLPENTEVVSKQLKNKSNVNTTYTNNPSNKGSKVLIVEDNPYMVDYYEKILSPIYSCEFAFNGEEGLEKLKEKQFDLVVSDVMMPKLNGIEFRKEMKKFPENENIPFVLVTALGYEENKVEAFNIGVDDYIVKPFSKNELVARINCLLENKEKRESWIKHANETEKEVETFEEKNLKKLQEIILENIDEENFSVALLAEKVNFSQRQLERIIKKLTGLTPVKFILEVRLQEAYKKIKNKEEADINNVRYSVGIKSASYFSVKFKQRFGVSPSELLKAG
ncbi:His Kinase A (phospho-acceptor) domain-containing protein [Tenacibaculum sp. MAR_2009_124]|nr:His Kinase A (phospho-acceptor) domain-containing protein [Tenacibaculum sp. MAR_2009_124]